MADDIISLHSAKHRKAAAEAMAEKEIQARVRTVLEPALEAGFMEYVGDGTETLRLTAMGRRFAAIACQVTARNLERVPLFEGDPDAPDASVLWQAAEEMILVDEILLDEFRKNK